MLRKEGNVSETVFFDIRGYFEISVFEITRFNCYFSDNFC